MEKTIQKKSNCSYQRIPYCKVSEPGIYQVFDACEGEYWLDIKVYLKAGLLRMVNHRNNIECAVKSLCGWSFRLQNKE
jgi:hypothetical protein